MLNHITICGRICNELELKKTPSGVEVISFAVACERDFKDKDGNKQTDFIDCVAFRNTAVFLNNYFAKGRAIIVDGKLQTRNWEDKNGNKRKAVEIIADNVYFADSKTEGGANKTATQGNFAPDMPEFEEFDDDDTLPF